MDRETKVCVFSYPSSRELKMRCHEEAAGMVERADGSSPPLPSGLKKGPWTAAEDTILVEYVRKHGEGNWNAVQKNSGLQRCGKSCRLRWANHLRPNLKKGSFTPDEELLILRLHAQLGNKWARMAAQLPGRTDNEIKNYWNTRIKRRTRAGLPMYPPDMHRQAGTGHHHLLHHHHHQQQQPLSSWPNTTPPITPTSTPAYDLATGFPTASRPAPLLSSNPFPSKPVLELPTIKRIRSGAFQFPTSGLTTLPLYHHHPPAAAAQYSLGNYDRNLVVQVASLSVKTELPSSQCQLFSVSAGCANNGNSGLLDAMLQEAQGIGGDQLKNLGHPPPSPQQHGGGDARVAEWAQLAAAGSASGAHQSPGLGLYSVGKPSSSQCPFGMKSKTIERAEESNNVQDISMMLDMIPSVRMSAAAAVAPDWYNSTDSGEMSNGGQSSSMTDDEIGLEMQQLASSLSVAPEDRDWSIGSCSWNNMPGIC